MMRAWKSGLLFAALAVAVACSSSSDDGPALTSLDAGAPETSVPAVAPEPEPFPATPPANLSAAKLFADPPIVDGQIQPAADMERYELATALFSDYALKTRAIRFPKGKAAKYDAREVMDFPVGTVITKTFSMEKDRRDPKVGIKVVETRVLVREDAGWVAYPYLWNDEQTEATYAPGGRVVPIDTIDASGQAVKFSYLVPSKNQCQECHHVREAEGPATLTLIGPKARNINIVVNGKNQLDHWAEIGKLEGLPPAAERPTPIDAFDTTKNTAEQRARTYVDVNCAHCHRPESTVGIASQLFLDIWNTDQFKLGICKRPGSAGPNVGGTFDIVPGDHTTSILWFRMQTTDSGKMMPLIGRATQHAEGAAVVAAWIDAMPAQACQ